VAALNEKFPSKLSMLMMAADDKTYAEYRVNQRQAFEQNQPVKHRFSVGQSTAIHTGVNDGAGQL